MGLREQGVRLVAAGDAAFINTMHNADKSVKGFNQTTERADKPMKGLTAGALALGNAMGQALYNGAIAATRAINEFMTSSIGAASDLAETTSKIGVVFENQGDAILKWGANSAAALGMSSNEALSAAGTYGNLFRSMGIGVDTSADMSTSLVQLAADLASFNNLTPEEVLEKLRAGLVGEAEPLKSLGININEAILKEKALEMGLYSGTGALDAQTKAMAAYAVMMEQSTLAQGDFARTSEGLANQQRIAAANVANLKAKLGTALLPIVTAVTKAFNTLIASPFFQGLLEKVVGWLSGISTSLTNLMSGITSGKMDFGEAIGKMLSNLFTGKLTQPAKFLEIGMGIVTGLAEGIANAIPNLVTVALSLLEKFVEFITNSLPMIIEVGLELIVSLVTGIANAIPNLISTVMELIPKIAITLLENLPKIIEAALKIIIALATGLIKAIPVLLPQVPKIIEAIFTAIIESLPLILEAAIELITVLIGGIIQMLPTLVKQAGEIVGAIIVGISNLLTKIYNIGKDIVTGLWNGIKGQWSWLIDKVSGVAKGLLDTIKKILGIGSPSKVLKGFGIQMDIGWAEGILEGAKLPAAASAVVAQAAVAPAMAAANMSYSYSTTNQYNLTVMTSQNPMLVRNSFSLMQMLAG